jgi:hypothetical protein
MILQFSIPVRTCMLGFRTVTCNTLYTEQQTEMYQERAVNLHPQITIKRSTLCIYKRFNLYRSSMMHANDMMRTLTTKVSM